MKIIEVRDGFIKFEADERVYLSSFILVEGTDKNYVAQINQYKKFGDVCIANAKILFIIKDEELLNYDKTLPSKDAELKPFTPNILKNSLNHSKPVIAGKTLDNKLNINIDVSAFDKKMLISVDSAEFNNIIVRNLSKQFENFGLKTLVIDTLGVIKSQKYKAGKDFKLPINTQTLDFIYKSCLSDATAESKSLISEIFKELAEYSQTVPFVPFEVLKSIIDSMVDNEHIFRLLVLKNKLAKFEKLGYFATEQKEIDNFNKIIDKKNAIIDLSSLDKIFQNIFIEYIYSSVNNPNVQILFEASNNISKKNLKYIIFDSNLHTTFITHSSYLYLDEIKNFFDNFILEASYKNQEIFNVYSSFFGSMDKDTYLITGESINYIPMVSKIQLIEDVIPYTDANETDISTDKENELNSDNIAIGSEESLISENIRDEEFDGVVEENSIQAYDKQNPTTEEIIANIEEKSGNIIDSVSESIAENQEIDVFGDESDDNTSENSVENQVETTYKEEAEEENVIEPEYTEIEDSSIDSVESIEVPDLRNEQIILNEEPLEEDILVQDENELEEDIKSDIEINSEQAAIQEEIDTSENPEIENINDETEEISEYNIENGSESVQINSEDEMLLDSLEEDEHKSNIMIEDFESNMDDLPVIPMPDLEEDSNEELEEIVELDPEEIDDGDIVVDISDNDDNINIDEETDKQIIEDVDKVFTTVKDETEELEEISDSDLDFIDELNSEDTVLEEYNGSENLTSETVVDEGILEQPQESIIPKKQQNKADSEILEKRESSTPMVPIYDADIPQEDMVISDSIQQGDSVVHAKYGNGVVEKMIKYGAKTLFSINFENIGRRLLDPALTEIKKL